MADVPLLVHPLAAYHMVPTPVAGSPFSISVDQLVASQNVSLVSAYRAAQLLLESTNGGHKHFLYVGNVMHKPGHAWPNVFTLGLGKASAAHMVEIGSKAYGKNGGAMSVDPPVPLCCLTSR
jgi:hypothetical protein